MSLSFRQVRDQVVHLSGTLGDIINVVKYQKIGFLKEQSCSPFNGLIHNPVINKRITLTDMSLQTEISSIVSNCLIYSDLQFMPTKY